MLISQSYPTRTGVRVIITDTEQCEICHRTAEECQLNPWPNHDFMPRTYRADQLPPRLRARLPDPAAPDPKQQPPRPAQEGIPL